MATVAAVASLKPFGRFWSAVCTFTVDTITTSDVTLAVIPTGTTIQIDSVTSSITRTATSAIHSIGITQANGDELLRGAAAAGGPATIALKGVDCAMDGLSVINYYVASGTPTNTTTLAVTVVFRYISGTKITEV